MNGRPAQRETSLLFAGAFSWPEQGRIPNPSFRQSAVFGEIALMQWLLIKGAKPPAQDAAALSSAAG